MSARTVTAAFLFLLLPSGLIAQDDCNSLSIASIRYSAFDPSIVEVRTLNTGGGGFNYPSLVLFDGNGDTLARDHDNFFVIGPDQTFLLPLVSGANVPVGPFAATLHVRVDNAVACAFELQADLCPPPPCVEVYPFVSDQGGSVSDRECYWMVLDDNAVSVATGTLVIPAGSTQMTDTVCLAPGTYSLGMSEVSGTGVDLHFRMNGSGWWNSPASPTVFIESGMVSPFVLHEACIGSMNAIPETRTVGVELTVVNGILRIQCLGGTAYRQVEVMDAAGRLVRTAFGPAAASGLDINNLAPGVLVVRTTNVKGVQGSHSLCWAGL